MKKEYEFHALSKTGDGAWAFVFAVVYMLTAIIILGIARLISIDAYKYLTTLSVRNRPNILVWGPGAVTGLCAGFFTMSHFVKPIHIYIDGIDVSVTQGRKTTAFRLTEIKKVKYLKSEQENLTYRILQIKASGKKIYIAVREMWMVHTSQEDLQQIEEFYHVVKRCKDYNEDGRNYSAD